jgi:hypothetical protein
LGITIKYLRGAAGIGLDTMIKHQRPVGQPLILGGHVDALP